MQESSTRADKAPQDCGEAKPPQEEMRTEKDHDQAVEVDDTLRSEGLGELSELQDADANDTREEVQDNNAGSAQDHDNDENHAIEPGGGSQWQVPEEDRDNEEETAEELLLCSGRKDHDKQVKTVEGLLGRLETRSQHSSKVRTRKNGKEMERAHPTPNRTIAHFSLDHIGLYD